jgi:hypothetical protein
MDAPWTIANIPDGRYVVLAAFENDACVRDPDTCMAGTETVHIELPLQAGMDAGQFKVTEALPTIGPGVDTPESVSAPLTLRWGGESNDDTVRVEVFDAYGDIVWMTMRGATTNSTEMEPYLGPLDPGMYYQFRATSLGMGGTCPRSRTEDLRGVFFVP